MIRVAVRVAHLAMQLALAALGWVDRHIPAFTALLLILVFPTYRFFELEMGVYDFHQKSRAILEGAAGAPIGADLVVIAVDDEAVRRDPARRLALSGATSRAYLADVVERIASTRPAVLALDYLLDEPAPKPEDDRRLANTLLAARRAGVPVVLASRLVRRGAWRDRIVPLPEYLAECRSQGGAPLYVGHVNVETYRTDGVVREVVPATALDTGYFAPAPGTPLEAPYSMSLPMQILRARHLEKAAHALPARVLIDFATGRASARWISSAAVMDGATVPLEGAIALVGDAREASKDRHATPLSVPTTLVPGLVVLDSLEPEAAGVQLHAVAYRALEQASLGSRTIVWANQWAVVAVFIVFLVPFGAAVVLRRLALRALVAVAATTIAAYAIAGAILFHTASVYLPLVRPTAAVLALVMIFRALQKAATDTGRPT
jgi:CHASE2 domain-containing sensor protein